MEARDVCIDAHIALEQHVTLSLITVNVINSSPALPGLQHETNSLTATFLLNTVNVGRLEQQRVFTGYSENWRHSVGIEETLFHDACTDYSECYRKLLGHFAVSLMAISGSSFCRQMTPY